MISAMILFIILGATFSQILSFSGATEGIVSGILGQGLSPGAMLACMLLLLIFVGVRRRRSPWATSSVRSCPMSQ
jgi:TRAP-type C4-dicarboxylate transport system permease large subunit